jgi:hypothetical protein
MKMLRITRVLFAFLLLSGAFAGAVQAVTITYEVENLNDSPGQDLWRYSYMVSDFNFSEGYVFEIDFNYGLFEFDPLVVPNTLNSEWDLLVVPPDVVLGNSDFDGFFDAQALSDGASLNYPFIVDFVWLGIEEPGSQVFRIYNGTDWETPIFSGFTTTSGAPVPEPGTFVLLATGLLGLARVRRSLFIP